MSSPVRTNTQRTDGIPNQLGESPTRYDIDFYLRKISRLQNDLTASQDDLNRAKVRLRRAQDYQIKYDLLLKQLSTVQCELETAKRQAVCAQMEFDKVKDSSFAKENTILELNTRVINMKQQIEAAALRLRESEDKRFTILSEIKEKTEGESKREIQALKRQHIEKNEEYETQIRQLRKQLFEKEAIETTVNNRVERVRRQKDQQIELLKANIQSMSQQTEGQLQSKGKQLEGLTARIESMFTFEFDRLKQNRVEQSQTFTRELNGLRQVVGLKNEQLNRVITELNDARSLNVASCKQYQEAIRQLKERMSVSNRENELELFGLKERLSHMHTAEITEMNKKHSEIIEGLRLERKDLEKQIEQRTRLLEADRGQLSRIKGEYNERLKERDTRIAELQERIRTTSQITEKEVNNLHRSFNQIENEKEHLTSEYHHNVEFLNQQLAKLAVVSEGRLNEIKQLHEQISRMRVEATAMVEEVEAKWKEERKQTASARQQDRKARDQLLESIREKERDFRIKLKQAQREKDQLERENDKLKFVIEEMEKDSERMNAYNKQLDDALKREMKKNQTSTMDNGGIRRELSSELERQTAELEALKRTEVDHIRQKFELESDRMLNENMKLKKDFSQKSSQYQQLKERLQQLEAQNKHIESVSRDKLLEYEKKMATLNQEIYITQNMYQSFLASKVKAK